MLAFLIRRILQTVPTVLAVEIVNGSNIWVIKFRQGQRFVAESLAGSGIIKTGQ